MLFFEKLFFQPRENFFCGEQNWITAALRNKEEEYNQHAESCKNRKIKKKIGSSISTGNR